MILLIDNYDSFTFNLKRYLVQLGQEVTVVRNDAELLRSNLADSHSALVISPGPKTPQAAGMCLSIVAQYSGQLPILGVCLGHQVIYEACGGVVGRALRPTHGSASPMQLLTSPLFAGIESGTVFARYHSLVGLPASLPESLRVIAWSPEREIMAVEHKQHATFGVQFHPESILSLSGHRLMRNFLVAAGLATVDSLPLGDLSDPAQVNPPIAAELHGELAVALPGRYGSRGVGE